MSINALFDFCVALLQFFIRLVVDSFQTIRDIFVSFNRESFFLQNEEYISSGIIAEGGFGTVYLVTKKISSHSRGDKSVREHALKKIISQSEEQLQDAQWEIEVHRLLGNQNPNLAPLLAEDIHSLQIRSIFKEVLLLYPLYENGSLVDLLRTQAATGCQLSEGVVMDYFSQICNGLSAFHSLSPPLAHRDLKPHNLLLTNRFKRVVLIDFGSAAHANVDVSTRKYRLELQDHAHCRSSMPYRAPELWEPSDDSVVDTRTDIWSLGCVLYSMLFGQGYSPFECRFASDAVSTGRMIQSDNPVHGDIALGLNEATVPKAKSRDCTYLGTIGTIPFPSDHSRSPALVELVLFMLRKNPSKRPFLDAVVSRIENLKENYAFSMN